MVATIRELEELCRIQRNVEEALQDGFDEQHLKTINGDTVPVHIEDQFKAAERESGDFLERVGGLMGGLPISKTKMSVRSVARCIAALYRCLDHCCEHYQAAIKPMVAYPGIRVGMCKDCAENLSTDRHAFIVSAYADDIHADECDMCLSQTSMFHDFSIAYGPTTIIGSICEKCLADFSPEEL